jgi:FKBP-type peptidyl-prolyl cis-trans isomerase FkpA
VARGSCARSASRRGIIVAGLGLLAACAVAEPGLDQRRWDEQQKQWLAANLMKPGWRATPSGLQYRPSSLVPDGARPAAQGRVTITYVAALTSGKVVERVSEPLEVPIEGLIPGLREGVTMMRVGEVWDFAMPAALAWGQDGAGRTRPDSVITHHVKLVGWRG